MSEPNPHGPDKDPHPPHLPEPHRPAPPGVPEPYPAPDVFPIDHPRERPDGRPEIPPGDVPGGNHAKGHPMDIITNCANVLDAYLQANPGALRGSQRCIPVGQNQLRVIVRVVIGGFIKCGSVEPDATELLNAIASRLDEELAGVVGVTKRDARHPQARDGRPSDAPNGARQAPYRSFHPVPA